MSRKSNKNAKKAASELRNNRINFKLNDQELEVFNKRKGNQKISPFIRSVLLSGTIKTIYIDKEKTVIKNKMSVLRTEFGRIGKNINQLVKIINYQSNKGDITIKILEVEKHLLALDKKLEAYKKVLSNLSEFS